AKRGHSLSRAWPESARPSTTPTVSSAKATMPPARAAYHANSDATTMAYETCVPNCEPLDDEEPSEPEPNEKPPSSNPVPSSEETDWASVVVPVEVAAEAAL